MSDIDGEEWRVIPNFPDYAISNMGRVKRLTTRKGARGGRILKPCDCRGYAYVVFGTRADKKTFRVHRLVAEAFIGPAPEGRTHVNHINFIRSDNRVSNLEWTSHLENMRHSQRHGRLKPPKGEKHWCSKLSDKDVENIRAEYKAGGVTQISIAKKYGVGGSTVGQILTGVRRSENLGRVSGAHI